jgi:hypothetical protein
VSNNHAVALSGYHTGACPKFERAGSKSLERGSAEVMTLDVEAIVYGGSDVQEALAFRFDYTREFSVLPLATVPRNS